MTQPVLAHSFVVRISLEEPPTPTAPLRWRGRVTNVLDDVSRSIETFDQLESFISGYIDRWRDVPYGDRR